MGAGDGRRCTVLLNHLLLASSRSATGNILTTRTMALPPSPEDISLFLPLLPLACGLLIFQEYLFHAKNMDLG